MKLTFRCEGKKEKTYLEDFLNFYEALKNVQIEDIVYSPDQENRTEKRPDYLLEKLNIAVEIKKITVEKWEKEFNTQDNKTVKIETLINNLLSQNENKKNLKKRIVIMCPPLLYGMKKSRIKFLVRSFFEKLINDEKIFQEKNYNFMVELNNRKNIDDKSKDPEKLIFSVLSIFESDKPSVVLYTPVASGAIFVVEQIRRELEKAICETNVKFGSFKSSSKILLLIDYYLGNINDYLECLDNDLKNRLLESNIDQIWLQFRRIPDICIDHQLLWSKK